MARTSGEQENENRRKERLFNAFPLSSPVHCGNAEVVGDLCWHLWAVQSSSPMGFNPCCPALSTASYTSPRQPKPHCTQVLCACSGAMMMEKGQQLLPLFYTTQLRYQAASVSPGC